MTIIARRKLINTSILVKTTYSLFCATTSDHEWKEEKLKQVVFLITWTFTVSMQYVYHSVEKDNFKFGKKPK